MGEGTSIPGGGLTCSQGGEESTWHTLVTAMSARSVHHITSVQDSGETTLVALCAVLVGQQQEQCH